MRARLLILASAIGMLGWGAVLPFQYAYAADTRGWGALVAAAASSLFSVGALLAAPVGGRLSDRHNPVTVAVVAQLVGALGPLWLLLADSAGSFLLAMLVFGLGLTASVPAKQVLVLRWVPGADRRKVFAYKFTGEALGMAVGAFVAGHLVDLRVADGMAGAFLLATLGFAVSSLILWSADRAPVPPLPVELGEAVDQPVSPLAALRTIAASPALRWTALMTLTLALGFYAQFESGLPAYALTVLSVEASTIGTAAAVNSLVIVLLQVVMVRLTSRFEAPSLLMVVGGIWALSWTVLSTAQLAPGLAPALFITTFGIFAVGETMYSPVLNPLVASLAPRGMVGQTLGLFAALQTSASALGPLLAGLLLGAGLAQGFLGAHLGVSLLAVYAAWRLRVHLRAAARPAQAHPAPAPDPEAAAAGPRETPALAAA